jgi:hypothetical protein
MVMRTPLRIFAWCAGEDSAELVHALGVAERFLVLIRFMA